MTKFAMVRCWSLAAGVAALAGCWGADGPAPRQPVPSRTGPAVPPATSGPGQASLTLEIARPSGGELIVLRLDGKFIGFWTEEGAVPRGKLTAELQRHKQQTTTADDVILVVRADASVPASVSQQIIQLCQAEGIEHFALRSNPAPAPFRGISP